ncbi:MAG: anti-sigma factor family protein [Christensenellales bacterium]
MKNECSIVCDLLPLYAEDMVSEDTAEFVKEHLGNCPTCRAELEKLRKPVQPVAAQHVPDIDAEPLKRLKKALLMEKVQAILCTAAVLLALMLSGLSFLTAPEYFAYSQELVTVTEGANGEATISFSSEITDYKLQRIADPADKQTVYHLEVWTCAWDRMFSKPGAQDVTVKPENGHELLIYFTQFINQSSSNSAVCIYGEIEPDSGGWMALPGLSMGYWLAINIVLLVILGVIWLNLRKKEKPRRLVERLILIPIAYMLGHLCVLGFHTLSYSEWRDAQMILAIGILFYCAMLLALSIFYSRKELRDMRRDGSR